MVDPFLAQWVTVYNRVSGWGEAWVYEMYVHYNVGGGGRELLSIMHSTVKIKYWVGIHMDI